jgi:uncharacterized membrane protein
MLAATTVKMAAMDETMSRGRLEAFSDGVFAIAITLLILDVTVPPGSGAHLAHSLAQEWPAYLAYVTSFLTIAVIWINHHAMFSKVTYADRRLVFSNSVFLMVVAFIPFPTRLLAEYVRDPNGAGTAAVFYGLTFVVLSVVFNLTWRAIAIDRRLVRDEVPQADLKAITRSFRPGIPMYIAATLVAFVSPVASAFLYLVIALFYALPAQLVTRVQR